MHMHNSLHSNRLAEGKSSLDKHLVSSTIAPVLGLVSGALAGGVEVIGEIKDPPWRMLLMV